MTLPGLRRRCTLVVSACSLAVGLVGLSSTNAAAAVNGQIYFAGFADGNTDLYSIGADGVGLTRLTTALATDSSPVPLPDATRIAFVRTLPLSLGGTDLLVMKLDGSGLRKLTDDLAVDSDPAVSADGKRIAFVSNRDGDDFELYTIGVDGTGLTRVTDDDDDQYSPSFSPDGKRLAFLNSTTNGGVVSIRGIGVDGRQPALLAADPLAADPVYSPNGSSIYFATERGSAPDRQPRKRSLWSMNSDGSMEKLVVRSNAWDYSSPTPSPDGRRMAWTRDKQAAGTRQIVVGSFNGVVDASLPVPETLQVAEGSIAWGTSTAPAPKPLAPPATIAPPKDVGVESTR